MLEESAAEALAAKTTGTIECLLSFYIGRDLLVRELAKLHGEGHHLHTGTLALRCKQAQSGKKLHTPAGCPLQLPAVGLGASRLSEDFVVQHRHLVSADDQRVVRAFGAAAPQSLATQLGLSGSRLQ